MHTLTLVLHPYEDDIIQPLTVIPAKAGTPQGSPLGNPGVVGRFLYIRNIWKW